MLLIHNHYFALQIENGEYGVQVKLLNLNVQSIIAEMGFTVNLGLLNLYITNVEFTLATVDVPALNIEKGLVLGGDIGFMGMYTNVSLKVVLDEGAKFHFYFNQTEFRRVRSRSSVGRP